MQTLRLALLAAVSLALTACDRGETSSRVGEGAVTSGASDRRTFDVAPFDRLEIAGTVDAEVVAGDVPSVVAVGPNRANLVVRQDGSRLILTQRDRSRVDDSEFRVTVPRLTGLTISGTGDMSVARVPAEALEINLSGTGSLDIAGEARSARVTLSGTGDLDGEGFSVSDDLSIVSRGTGDATLRGGGSVTIEASGAGDIRVTGARNCRVQNSGAGDVTCG